MSIAEDDQASGTIYVLRSKSDHPLVAANRDIVPQDRRHRREVEQRIANARLDPTFLMADVEVVATYELFNINRTKLENLIHRVFGPAQLDIEIKDRFGQPIMPEEWFLVPLFAMDEAVRGSRTGRSPDMSMTRRQRNWRSPRHLIGEAVSLPVQVRHIQYVIAAADHGSFRRAAAALGVQEFGDQPAASASLEDRLGRAFVHPLDRAACMLTQAGQAVRPARPQGACRRSDLARTPRRRRSAAVRMDTSGSASSHLWPPASCPISSRRSENATKRSS